MAVNLKRLQEPGLYQIPIGGAKCLNIPAVGPELLSCRAAGETRMTPRKG